MFLAQHSRLAHQGIRCPAPTTKGGCRAYHYRAPAPRTVPASAPGARRRPSNQVFLDLDTLVRWIPDRPCSVMAVAQSVRDQSLGAFAMSEIINQDRRRFMGAAAMTIAAARFG